MIKKRFTVSIALLALVAISIFIFSKSKFFTKKTEKDKPQYATAKKGDITIELNTKGRLKPLKSAVITAPRKGGKITYLIPEGTYVKKGDLLAQFDKVDLEIAVNDAKFNLEEELIKEDTRKRESDKKITKTRLTLQGTRDSLRKIIPEVLDGKKTTKDLQWAKYNLKEAEINYGEAKKKYEQYQIKGSPQLRRRKDKLAKAKRNLAETEIISVSKGLVVYEFTRRSGVLDKIKPGDTVWRNQAIISLPDLSEMLVIVEISEVDLSKAKTGQKCFIKLDAYPDKIFTGKITNKGNLVKDSVFLPGVKIVKVEITIDGEHAYLKPGMTASVDIVVDTLKNVISVPITGVFEDKNKYYCYLVKGANYIKKEVKIGEETNENVVITEGINENERITLFDPYLEK